MLNKKLDGINVNFFKTVVLIGVTLNFKTTSMKNRLLFALLLGLTFCSLSAQDLNFGVKGGVNVASIGGGNNYVGVAGLGSKVGFHLGGVVESPFSEKFSLQAELLYSLQGSKWSIGSGSNLNLNYINLPILGKYYIIEGLSAEAGPLVGFLLSTNADKADYGTIDIAFAIGASYKLNENIFFSLRYNKGISNINKNDSIDYNNQNNVFQISAGYMF